MKKSQIFSDNRVQVGSKEYVFYENLKDYIPSIYGKAKQRVYDFIGDASQVKKDNASAAELLRNMAFREAEKEVKLIKKRGRYLVDINANTYFSGLKKDPEEYFKRIVETINKTMQLEGILKRNLMRVKSDSKQNNQKIDIATYTWQYLRQEMTSQSTLNKIENEVKQIFDLYSNNNKKLLQQLEQFFLQLLEESAERAIDKMLDSTIFTGKLKDVTLEDGDNGYKELRDFLTANPDYKREFIDKIKGTYEFSKIAKNLVNAAVKIEDNAFKTKKGKIINKYKKTFGDTFTGREIALKGGNIAEYVETLSLKTLASVLNGSFSVEQTGWTGSLPDQILGIDIEQPKNFVAVANDLAQELGLTSAVSLNRDQLQLAIDRFYKQIKGTTNSFLVYVSDKYYNTRSEEGYFQKIGGFSGGQARSLEDYKRQLGKSMIKTSNMIGAILQIGKGAVGTPELEEKISQFLAATFAYFLFDDYRTLGKKQQGVQVIHLLDLNGTLIPLSLMLYSLSEAFENYRRNDFKELVNVNLEAPEIKYPEGNPEGSHRWTLEDWETQKDYAMKNTKISIAFLHNFVDIVSRYL